MRPSMAILIVLLSVPGVAIGGSLGAKRYDPDLDVVGVARLDLSVHTPDRKVSLDFMEALDPAFERTSDHGQPAHVAVHFVRRLAPLFDLDDAGLMWADPVECLLDLHEVRLESQAEQFVRRLEASGVGQS